MIIILQPQSLHGFDLDGVRDDLLRRINSCV